MSAATAAASQPDIARAADEVLGLSGVGKRFGAFAALTGVDLTIRSGEVHCLLGENGAGKSTLCNLLFGIHRPDSGAMRLDGTPYAPAGPRDALRAGIGMVHQHFSLIDDMSVVDNLLLGQARGVLDRAGCAAQVRALSERFGLAIAPMARVGDISVGERQRVEIIKCLMRTPRVLILDEPTAVLLPDEIRSLLGVIRRVAADGCAVVLVTHKLAEIRDVADTVSVLRQGRIVANSQQPAADIAQLVRAMIQRPVEGLDPAMMVTLGMVPDAPPAAAPARAPVSARERSTLPPLDALQLDGITVRDGVGAPRLDTLTLTVKPGEIVGVAGVEGNGQSELGMVLAGLRVPDEGRVVVAGQDLTGRRPRAFTAAGMGIVPEDRHLIGAIVDMSLADNLFLDRARVPTRFGLLRRRDMQQRAQAMMERFDIRAAGPQVAFGSLSGGNQQKAVLGRELTLPGLKVLLAAQPTRGLDVGAVEAVYRLIREACDRGVAVLLISSELDEIIAVADRVLVLYRGRVVGECAAEPAQRERIGSLMAGHGA